MHAWNALHIQVCSTRYMWVNVLPHLRAPFFIHIYFVILHQRQKQQNIYGKRQRHTTHILYIALHIHTHTQGNAACPVLEINSNSSLYIYMLCKQNKKKNNRNNGPLYVCSPCV